MDKDKITDNILEHLYGEMDFEQEDEFLQEAEQSGDISSELADTRKILTAYRLSASAKAPSVNVAQIIADAKRQKAKATPLYQEAPADAGISKSAADDASNSGGTSRVVKLPILKAAAIVAVALGLVVFYSSDNNVKKVKDFDSISQVSSQPRKLQTPAENKAPAQDKPAAAAAPELAKVEPVKPESAAAKPTTPDTDSLNLQTVKPEAAKSEVAQPEVAKSEIPEPAMPALAKTTDAKAQADKLLAAGAEDLASAPAAKDSPKPESAAEMTAPTAPVKETSQAPVVAAVKKDAAPELAQAPAITPVSPAESVDTQADKNELVQASQPQAEVVAENVTSAPAPQAVSTSKPQIPVGIEPEYQDEGVRLSIVPAPLKPADVSNTPLPQLTDKPGSQPAVKPESHGTDKPEIIAAAPAKKKIDVPTIDPQKLERSMIRSDSEEIKRLAQSGVPEFSESLKPHEQQESFKRRLVIEEGKPVIITESAPAAPKAQTVEDKSQVVAKLSERNINFGSMQKSTETPEPASAPVLARAAKTSPLLKESAPEAKPEIKTDNSVMLSSEPVSATPVEEKPKLTDRQKIRLYNITGRETPAQLLSKAKLLNEDNASMRALFAVQEALDKGLEGDGKREALTLKARMEFKLGHFKSMQSTIEQLREFDPLSASALSTLRQAALSRRAATLPAAKAPTSNAPKAYRAGSQKNITQPQKSKTFTTDPYYRD